MNLADEIVLAVYLLGIMILGWRFRVTKGDDEDFFLAGRSMGWMAVGLSVMVTVFSAINYVALPNEVAGHGLYVIVALPLFFIVAWPITTIWMPFFHDMHLTSAYEYLERRFDHRVRSLASGIFILWRLFWMATALFATARILGFLIGMAQPAVILLAGIAATAYTFHGGLRAVMWTDVVQFFVLFGGIVLGIHCAMGDVGISRIIKLAHEGGRFKPFFPYDPQFLSFDPRIRMTLWSGLIGVFVAFLSRYGADQVVMQRYFSAKNLPQARRGLWLNAAVSVLSLSLLALLGLAVYAHAAATGGALGNPMKQLAALMRSFPPGVTGLMAAGILAATMSSIDSGINACSAAYVTDFHKRYLVRKDGKTQQGLKLDKGLTFLFGATATALALILIPLVGKNNSLFAIVNKLINGLGSPLLALILLGMFTRHSNAPGLLYGGIMGLVASLSVSILVRPLALQYYAALNLLVSLAPCLILSFIAKWRGHVQGEERLKWTYGAWRARNAMECCASPGE